MLHVQAGGGIVADSVPETRMAGNAEQGAGPAARGRNGRSRAGQQARMTACRTPLAMQTGDEAVLSRCIICAPTGTSAAL